MLSQEQREALAAQMRQNVEKMKAVSPEELAQYPAEITELKVPTSQGDARVFLISSGESDELRPLVLNFHGGGFIGRRMARDELFCRKIANRLPAVVLDVDYKLAPEYAYPTAVLESWDVAKWAVENAAGLGADPGKLLLMGHSSGGNLVAGLCMKAGQTGAFRPLCAVIDYAPLDLVTDPGEKERSICDMPAERARMYNASYIAPENAKESYASPLFAPDALLEKFPDTLVISAGEDSLCAENEEFALRLGRAGVSVTMKRFTDSVHGFVINRCCQWEEALELICSFAKNRL